MAEALSETWVCQAWHCGEIYEGTDRFCPKCRNPAAPQKRIRFSGVILIICGVFLVGMMLMVSSFMVPLILAGGQEVNGSSFSGTPGDGATIIALFAAVTLFGALSIAAGYIQFRHGRQNWKLIGVMLGVVVVLCSIAWLVSHGLMMSRPGGT